MAAVNYWHDADNACVPVSFQHWKAPQDTDGNPRRCWVVFDQHADFYDAIDEGYAGRPGVLADLHELPEVDTTVTQYKEWLARSPSGGRYFKKADEPCVKIDVDEDGDPILTCSACGGSEFRYEESHPSTRTQDHERTDAHYGTGQKARLVFYSDFEWFDGDDDPGVVCVGCDAHLAVDQDRIDIDWTM